MQDGNESGPGEEKSEAVSTTIDLALTRGLSPGAKLRENRLFQITPTGLKFMGELSYEQWQDGMAMIKMMKGNLQVWLADFISHGRQLFGDEKVQETLAQMEFDYQDAQKAIAIGSLPAAVRRCGLTSEHYWVLAKAGLEDGQQEQWAALAEEHKLTPLQLVQSIAAGKVIKEGKGRNAGAKGIATVHGIRQYFDLWYHQVDKTDPITNWTPDRKRELWEELKGPVEVGVRLARELGIKLEEEISDFGTRIAESEAVV
jgi:hypothetical protein